MKVSRDPEELNRQARAAAGRALSQFKAEVPITETCPDCARPIKVTYVEPPADTFVTSCGCHRCARSFPGVLGPPGWVLAEREAFARKAAGASVVDATFYAMYFNECKSGNYFECPVDPRALSPEASDEVIADAIRRSRRLYHGANAYVGGAYFKYPGEPLTFAEAVKKLKRENPGFCEDVYGIVIDDNIRGMR